MINRNNYGSITIITFLCYTPSRHHKSYHQEWWQLYLIKNGLWLSLSRTLSTDYRCVFRAFLASVMCDEVAALVQVRHPRWRHIMFPCLSGNQPHHMHNTFVVVHAHSVTSTAGRQALPFVSSLPTSVDMIPAGFALPEIWLWFNQPPHDQEPLKPASLSAWLSVRQRIARRHPEARCPAHLICKRTITAPLSASATCREKMGKILRKWLCKSSRICGIRIRVISCHHRGVQR